MDRQAAKRPVKRQPEVREAMVEPFAGDQSAWRGS